MTHFMLFSYDMDIPQLNETYLQKQGKIERQKAENLFNLLKLDNVPKTPTTKDRRFATRNEARNYALECREGWRRVKGTREKRTVFTIDKDAGTEQRIFFCLDEYFQR